jgi:hypothetical protein
MEQDLQQAVHFARNSQAVEFKDTIQSILSNKIRDSVFTKKIEIAGTMFNTKTQQTSDSDSSDFRTEVEDQADEEL